MTGLHFPSPVTTMITRRVRPGREAEYQRWIREVSEIARTFPGHLGASVAGPHGDPPTYRVIVQFDTTDNLRRWLDSPEREAKLAEAEPLVLTDGDVELLTGLEAWFEVPGRLMAQPPPKWKMAVLTAVGVFPLLWLIGLALEPFTVGWSRPAVLAATLLLTIPLMTWLVRPARSRAVFGWLYPRSNNPTTPPTVP